MIISVVNFTAIPDQRVQEVLRAINRQIADDFEPYWHMGATLRLEGRIAPQPTAREQHPEELRGDAILYLWDEHDLEGALGYHDANYLGLPFGFVFTTVSALVGEPWSVTLSHEALELIGDANVNVFAAGPHPADPDKLVFHWYEMCDAVQAESYEIDSVTVSNFVLPLYFTFDDEDGGRNDFLGTQRADGRLRSFGVAPGGYVGFFDPAINNHSTWSHPGDMLAAQRMAAKKTAGMGRRALRYGELKPRGAWKRMTKGLQSVRQTEKGLLIPIGPKVKAQNGSPRVRPDSKKPQRKKTQKSR